MTEPSARSSRIAVLSLLAILIFATAVALDLGGLGSWFQKMLMPASPAPSSSDAGPAAAPGEARPFPGAQPPAPPPPPDSLTQAWFLDSPGYDGAIAEAKKVNASVVIYFRKPQCEPCKRVEHDLLAAPELKRALETKGKVRIDVSAGEREARIAGQYNVQELPELIAIAPDGSARRIALTRGGILMSPAQVIAALR